MKSDITGSEDHMVIQGGRDLRRSLAQPPAQAGSAVSSDQVVQGFVEAGIENLKHIEHAASLGHLCCCLIVLIGKKFLPIFSLNFLSVSLCPLPLILPSYTFVKSSTPASWQHLVGTPVPPKISLSQDDQAMVLWPLLTGQELHPDHPGGPRKTRKSLVSR